MKKDLAITEWCLQKKINTEFHHVVCNL